MQRDALLTDLTDEVNRLARRFVQGKAQLVLLQLTLQRGAQSTLRLKEAICWHQPPDSLVRTKVVVVAKPMPEPAPCILEVLRLRTIPKLVAHGLPQPLALPQGLRVVRAAHDVLNPLLEQQLLKAALSAPCKVLPPLVGQHILRLAKPGNPLQERFRHQRCALMRRQRPSHDETTVIIEKDCQINTPPLTS